MEKIYSNTDTRRMRQLFEYNRHLGLKRNVEDNGQAVDFANVAVVEAASRKVATGALADMDDLFQIKTPAKTLASFS